MRIAISDANILIDLANGGLLELMARLPYELVVTDFVIQEISRADQRLAVDRLLAAKCLTELMATQAELEQIVALSQVDRALSIPDCSVLILAGIHQALVLSNDSRVRRHAGERNLECHGTLWVVRQLFQGRHVQAEDAVDALSRLMAANPRLPRAECAALIREITGHSHERR